MLIHVATMVYSQGLFQFIPTFLFLSIARVNLTRDKLPNRKVICNLDKKNITSKSREIWFVYFKLNLHNAITWSCSLNEFFRRELWSDFFLFIFFLPCFALFCFDLPSSTLQLMIKLIKCRMDSLVHHWNKTKKLFSESHISFGLLHIKWSQCD